MSLQNRVNPYGDICFSANRGSFTGNRGVIHNEKQKIIRQFQVKRWIICLLKYKSYQRKVMTPNRWTELFFLDEATALAAGHRPCTFCQRQRSIEFRRHWAAANQAFYDITDIKVDAIDNILHLERMNREKPVVQIDDLPDGVFIEFAGKPNLVFDGDLFEWSFGGYLNSQKRPSDIMVKLLTPPSTMRALRHGFQAIVLNKNRF